MAPSMCCVCASADIDVSVTDWLSLRDHPGGKPERRCCNAAFVVWMPCSVERSSGGGNLRRNRRNEKNEVEERPTHWQVQLRKYSTYP